MAYDNENIRLTPATLARIEQDIITVAGHPFSVSDAKERMHVILCADDEIAGRLAKLFYTYDRAKADMEKQN